jgi:hypothetical protein
MPGFRCVIKVTGAREAGNMRKILKGVMMNKEL